MTVGLSSTDVREQVLNHFFVVAQSSDVQSVQTLETDTFLRLEGAGLEGIDNAEQISTIYSVQEVLFFFAGHISLCRELVMDTLGKVVSDPWSVLPIKNAKCARSTTEVHLSDRHIEQLGNFESFPNLEVLWLNNNKVTCR
jgi:hypothetical protein